MSELISVIMGLYNCEDTLSEALKCIINQTYEKWELIMCDDGSTDHTVRVAQKFVERFPEKIYLLRNEINHGLNYTLNRCLEKAKGVYVARMDGDDLCSATRFEKEVEVLDNNPSIAIVSTNMEFFDKNGVWGCTQTKAEPKNEDFVECTPFCHAACMVRRNAYRAVNGYTVDKKLLRVEDYYLWVRMYEKGFRGVNITEALYLMRDDRNAQSRRKFKFRLNEAYVKAYAVKHLNLPMYNYLYCLKPILVGIMPRGLYRCLHRNNYSRKKEKDCKK